MAGHTGFRGRDSGGSGSFNRGMTVAAVDSVIANVVFVAELDRLRPHHVLPGKI